MTNTPSHTAHGSNFEMIGALANIFIAMFHVDLASNTVQRLFSSDSKLPEAIVQQDISSVANESIDAFVAEDYREPLKEFIDPNTLPMRMVGRRLLSFEFVDVFGLTNRAVIIPVQFDDKGMLTSYLFAFRGIDEEERQTQQFAEEAEMNREILKGLSEEYFSVLLVDMDHDVVTPYRAGSGLSQVIANYCEYVSNKFTSVIQQYAKDIVIESSRDEFTEKLDINYLRSHTEPYTVTYEADREPEVAFFQATVTYVVSPDGRRLAVIGTRNINDAIRREREQEQLLREAVLQAKRASKAKTDFLFSMSHDIRTPMNAIIGFTELLKKNIHNPEQALNYIRKIESSNSFLLSLINSVLEMARVESGKETLDEAIGDVYDFNDELYNLFEELLSKKGIRFTRTENIQHPYVIVDKTKLREIFLNILSNASKYTLSGGSVSIDLTELPSDRPGYAVFRTVISDTGIGMSKEFLPHLFDEFSREKSSTASGILGTGLGMPIVKKLVELMKGSIEVQSELGVGTTFTITLSHRIADESNGSLEASDHTDYQGVDFSGKRLLLAEDNEMNAEIAIELLKDEGFLIEHAHDGVECVSMLEHAPADYYDLILMDVQMPNMDGYKATHIIRRLPDPIKANIPIIAMTANAFEEDKKNAMRVGMNAHLAKPIQINVVKSTIGRILLRTAYDKEAFKFWRTQFRASQAFSEFEQKHTELNRECGCFIYEAHGEERILYADKTVIRMFGCHTYGEFFNHVGGSFKTMVHPVDIDRVEEEIDTQIRASEDNIDRVKYMITTLDGQMRYIDDIGRKLYTENGTTVFFVFIVDETD